MKSNANLFFAVLAVIGFLFFWNAFVVSRYSQPKPVATQGTQRPDTKAASEPVLSIATPTGQKSAPA